MRISVSLKSTGIVLVATMFSAKAAACASMLWETSERSSGVRAATKASALRQAFSRSSLIPCRAPTSSAGEGSASTMVKIGS